MLLARSLVDWEERDALLSVARPATTTQRGPRPRPAAAGAAWAQSDNIEGRPRPSRHSHARVIP